MSKVTASADITLLDFSVLLDMSTAIPTAKITNLSTIVNANNLQWIFEFLSPSLTPIHTGSFTAPDINGAPFTIFTFTEPIPEYFRQLEFGNSPYTIKVSVKDLAGGVFYLIKGASICKPNGNNGKNNFGVADIDVQVKCAQGQLYVTDKTNLVYKSITGTKVSTSLQLTYPRDTNGNILTPVTVTSIPALLPIKYEGEGHEVYVFHVYDYNMGDNFTVRVRYSFTKVFPVWCNITLQPLFCEIDKVVDMLQKDCNDSPDNRDRQKTLGVVNAKMLKAHTGIVQPLSDIDVPGLVEEIKEILGVECECCRPSGISNVGVALATDATFTANKICGDMLLSWSNDGNGNIILNYQNTSYTFVIANDSESAAFSYVPTTSGCNKQVALRVDITVLSSEILSEIQTNPTLLNILNSITQRAQLSCSGLDGGDAFDFSACDYSVELDATIAGKTLDNILITGVTYSLPTGTLLINNSAIQSFLNGLGKGTFTVNYSGITNKTTINSFANSNTISTVKTSIGLISTTTAVSNNCGLICNILQKILTYMNQLNLVKIKTGVGITVCRFKTDGTVLATTFDANAPASSVAFYMAESICNVVDYLKTRVLSCDNLRNIFANYTDAMGLMGVADTVPIWLNGKCIGMPFKKFAISLLRSIRTDSEVKGEYCLITPCTTVSSCSPVTGLVGSGSDTVWNYTWNIVAGATGYKWSTDGTTWNTVVSTSAFISSLIANTSYTFRVYPVYPLGDGVSCVVTSNFTTTNTGSTCAAPATLNLSGQTLSSFVATWSAVTGAEGYQYRLNGGSWVNNGTALTVTPTVSEGTTYTVEVRAIIGGIYCSATITAAITTLFNYAISGGYAMTITAVSGTGIPSLAPSLSSPQYGHQTGITSGASVTLTGTPVVTTKVIAYVNNVQAACVAVPAAGTFSLVFTALVTDIVTINVNSGTC